MATLAALVDRTRTKILLICSGIVSMSAGLFAGVFAFREAYLHIPWPNWAYNSTILGLLLGGLGFAGYLKLHMADLKKAVERGEFGG